MSTIQLQSVGHVPAIEASEVREGDIRMYNFGSTGLIVKVIEKTPKTLMIITFENGKYYMYDIRKTSLVAIVKRDQDVSEHKPTQASYRRKGIVDISEYFQTEEIVEETIVNETIETENVESATIEKVEVKEITFLWSESPIVKNDTTVKTFEEAETIIFQIACNKDTLGYDKTKFMITWEDGHTYTGRIDVLKTYTSGKELKKHIEDHCTFFAGLRKAYHETMEEYENTLRAYGITEEDKQEYKLFLDTYLLEDVKSEPTNENLELIEETIESIEYNQTGESTEINNEITFQTNTGSKGNGIEITFTEKPSEDVRNLMKANGYRWAGKQRSNVWWAILNDNTLSIAEQLVSKQETTQEPVKIEYEEILIDDCTDEKYNIPQSLIDREHDANWIFRSNKKDYNKEIQELFISHTENVKEVTNKIENEYYVYKMKSSLQSFKKKYHSALINWLSAKASQPHWAVSGRGNLNKSKYEKGLSRQDKWMNELVNLSNDFNNKLNYYTNKDKKDQETKLNEQIKKELSQPLPDLNFKSITKELDIYGNGNKVKTRIYECEGYFTCKSWGAWRVYDTKTGKEIYSTKSKGTLQDAKAYISLMVKKQAS